MDELVALRQKLALTPVEAARLLGTTPTTIYRLIRNDGLPTIKLLGAMRIPTAEFETWIANRAATERQRRTAREEDVIRAIWPKRATR